MSNPSRWRLSGCCIALIVAWLLAYSVGHSACELRCRTFNCAEDNSGQCWVLTSGDCKWWIFAQIGACVAPRCTCVDEVVPISWYKAPNCNPECSTVPQLDISAFASQCGTAEGEAEHATCCQGCHAKGTED